MNIAIARKNLLIDQQLLDFVMKLSEQHNVCFLTNLSNSNIGGLNNFPSFNIIHLPSFCGIVVCTDDNSLKKILKFKYNKYAVWSNGQILEHNLDDKELECLKIST